MSNKTKGSNAERELLSFFTEQGWRAVRVAGSGVNENSPCDIIAAKLNKKGYAVEVKSSKKSIVYITKGQIEDFILFANIMGLKPTLALRFNYQGWFFISPRHLKDSGKYFSVSLQTALSKGKRFSQFFKN